MKRDRFKRWAKAAGLGLVLLVVLVMLLAWLFPFPAEKLIEARTGESALVLDQHGGCLAWRVGAKETWRLPVPLDRISPWMIEATLATEDRRFRSHCGVDPWAMLRAVGQNVSHARRVSGASTLTMQAVRLLWPRTRTYWAKCIEVFRAVQLERIAPKDHILQLYLNLAPYGGNVVGVEAAARRYFDKSAADLTLGESAVLAGLPQSPASYNPERHLERALERRKFVMARMRSLGLITDKQIEAALREPIRIHHAPAAENVPGFADFVQDLRHGQGGIIPTTLNPEIQAVVSQIVAGRSAEFSRMGIDGAAVVVIDVASSSLAAMVGSINVQDHQTGAINAALAKRQPGSLLKPFIYADAFDRGILTPDGIVYDIPIAWGEYHPRNMDRDYLGPLPAYRALMLSRNVPAVCLLDQLGPRRLANNLRRMGLNLAAAEERYGLSLALGTAEASLLDIANAYATLARLGRYQPLRVFPEEISTAGTTVFSPGAAYLVLRALGAAREDEPAKLIWKTGTSWQYRDAWTMALTPKYVIGVWCGKLGGSGHAALVGLHTAQPLALEIGQRITGGTGVSWPRPPTVRTRTVCALSGAPPTAACPRTLTSEFLPGISSDLPCSLHQFSGSGREQRVVTAWPKNVAAYLAGRSGQPAQPAARGLALRCPVQGGEYFVTGDPADAAQHLDFTLEPDKNVKQVFWFLNDRLAGTTAGSAGFSWPMSPGRYDLIACDEQGRSASVTFRILSINDVPTKHTLRGERTER